MTRIAYTYHLVTNRSRSDGRGVSTKQQPFFLLTQQWHHRSSIVVAVARLPQNRHIGVAEARLHVVVWFVVVLVLLLLTVLELRVFGQAAVALESAQVAWRDPDGQSAGRAFVAAVRVVLVERVEQGGRYAVPTLFFLPSPAHLETIERKKLLTTTEIAARSPRRQLCSHRQGSAHALHPSPVVQE